MNINDVLRPTSIEQIVGHADVKRKLLSFQQKRGFLSKAFWIVGPSGSGKTTISRIIANEVADDCTTHEIDAIDCTLDTLRDWERMAHSRPLFGSGYAFIINEAHNLSSKCVSRFQTLLESDCMRHSVYLFTTTDAGQMRLFDGKFDGFPFMSRCIQLFLGHDEQTMIDFTNYVVDISPKLGGAALTFEQAYKLLDACRFNLRMALNQLDMGVSV